MNENVQHFVKSSRKIITKSILAFSDLEKATRTLQKTVTDFGKSFLVSKVPDLRKMGQNALEKIKMTEIRSDLRELIEKRPDSAENS